MEDEVTLKPSVPSALFSRLIKHYLVDKAMHPLPHSMLAFGAGLVAFLLFFLPAYFVAPLGLALISGFLAGAPVVFLTNIFFLYREMQNRKYIIRDDGVEIVDDYLDKENTSASYENITDVSLNVPFLQRLFKTGDVEIQTAGSNTAEVEFGYLKNAEEVQEQIAETVRNTEYRQEYNGNQSR